MTNGVPEGDNLGTESPFYWVASSKFEGEMLHHTTPLSRSNNYRFCQRCQLVTHIDYAWSLREKMVGLNKWLKVNLFNSNWKIVTRENLKSHYQSELSWRENPMQNKAKQKHPSYPPKSAGYVYTYPTKERVILNRGHGCLLSSCQGAKAQFQFSPTYREVSKALLFYGTLAVR